MVVWPATVRVAPLDSPGVVALIGYYVAFSSPFSRPQGQKEYPKSQKIEAEPVRSASGYAARADECRHLATLDKGMREVTNLADTLMCCASLVAIYKQCR